MKKNADALKRLDKEVLEIEAVDEANEFARSGNGQGPGYGYGYGPEDAGHKVNLGQYWRAIRKRLWLIASLTVVFTILVTVYVAQKPDYFRATARVQVNLENNPALSNPAAVPAFGIYDPTYFSSQLQIIEGSGLLRRVVNTLDLPNNQAFVNPQRGQEVSIWQNVLRMLGKGKPRNVPTQSGLDSKILAPTTLSELSIEVIDDKEVERLAPFVSRLKGGLSVSPVRENRVNYKETRLIDISFTHLDPHVAGKIVNAIADTYVTQNLEKKIQYTATAGDFLQKRIAQLQAQIRSNEERLINYAKNNQILSLDPGQNTVVARLGDLNAKLSQAESDRIMAEAAYRASQLPGAATAQTDQDGRATALESRLSDLQNQRARLLVEYTDQAPEIIEIDKQIALAQQELKETRSRATKTLTTNLEVKYREALAREQDLRRVFNQQRAEVLAQNEAAINYRIIQQEIETDKSLLDGLLQRSKENDVVLTGTPNNVLVLDRALTPRGPVGPNRVQYIALAFLGSLILGVGLALLLNYLDDTLFTVDDVETKLHLPVLSEVPAIAKSKVLLPLASSADDVRRKQYYSLGVLDLGSKPALSEAYMILRTSVLLATAGGPPETLLITSGQPSEGKTTTAINMATVLAQTGARVLLVDADLRRPSLHAILGLNGNGYDPSKGLSSLLTVKSLDEQTLADSIRFHEASGLHVLVAGPSPPNPANLLCSPQMEQLLELLRKDFNYIVFDSPPVTFFTDGVLLSRLVDGVLLVVRSGKSPFEVVQRAKKLLWDAGASFLGVVLNFSHGPESKYYPYYYYDRPAKLPEADSSVLKLDAN